MGTDRRDPRPGFEVRERPHRRWWARGDVVFGLGVGLVLSAALLAAMPDVRTHVLGGTDRRETTIVDVRVGTRSGGSDRAVTEYTLSWEDDGQVRSATLPRTGPLQRDVGETWTLWVSPDGSVVEPESPLVTRLWLGLGIPGFCVVLVLLRGWHQRVLARMTRRQVERHVARRARRDDRPPPS